MIARERFPFEIDGDLGLSQQQRQGKFQISRFESEETAQSNSFFHRFTNYEYRCK